MKVQQEGQRTVTLEKQSPGGLLRLHSIFYFSPYDYEGNVPVTSSVLESLSPRDGCGQLLGALEQNRREKGSSSDT
jgi:hypothetical protein